MVFFLFKEDQSLQCQMWVVLSVFKGHFLSLCFLLKLDNTFERISQGLHCWFISDGGSLCLLSLIVAPNNQLWLQGVWCMFENREIKTLKGLRRNCILCFTNYKAIWDKLTVIPKMKIDRGIFSRFTFKPSPGPYLGVWKQQLVNTRCACWLLNGIN